jgi:hypothetical protein
VAGEAGVFQQLAEGEFEVVHKIKIRNPRAEIRRSPKPECRIASQPALLLGIRISDSIRPSDFGFGFSFAS